MTGTRHGGMFMDSIRFIVLSITTATGILASCGSDTTFSGEGTGRKNPPPPPNADITTELTGVNWVMECENELTAKRSDKKTDVVVKGKGKHEFDKKKFSKEIPVTISGKVCHPVKYPRDIVIVIDVSGSMALSGSGNGNDPMDASGRCGRLNAVETLVDSIAAQGGDAKFGIVTFSSSVVSASKTMSTDKTSLFAEISQSGTIGSVLCAAEGGTSYGAGLTSASSMLAYGRSDTIKEIYFVSDGAPEDGLIASAIAANLKANGVGSSGKAAPVQIATVMIGASDASILKSLASIDKSGKPLHADGIQASQLAQTLSGLAANDIDDGVVKYRAVGTQKWTEVPLKANMKGYDFEIPPFNFDAKSAPNGIELRIEYKDLHNHSYVTESVIAWQKTSERNQTKDY